MSQTRHISSSSSGLSSKTKVTVVLPHSLRKLYEDASKVDRTSLPWVRDSSQDIDIKLQDAKVRGVLVNTAIDYSVILLGSRCLNSTDVKKETIIQELYENRITKVQHGAFATKPMEWVSSLAEDEVDEMQIANQIKVSYNLEVFFNSRPEAREEVRRQWMESVSYNPHTQTGKFLAKYLLIECKFLIKEYIKHGAGLGLSVEEYVDLTSTLFDHCNPVETLGTSIDQEHRFARYNPFTKLSLASTLVSHVNPNQPIPKQVICQCNVEHICIMTEFRYRFEWERGNLVNDVPYEVYTRIDFCDTPQDAHKIFYLTKIDRLELKEHIKKSSSFFGYKTADGQKFHIQPPVSNVGVKEESSHQNVDDDGFELVTRRKGKKKQ